MYSETWQIVVLTCFDIDLVFIGKTNKKLLFLILKDCGAKVRPTGSSKVPTNSKTGGSRFDVESKQNEKLNYHFKMTK